MTIVTTVCGAILYQFGRKPAGGEKQATATKSHIKTQINLLSHYMQMKRFAFVQSKEALVPQALPEAIKSVLIYQSLSPAAHLLIHYTATE